MKHIFSLCLIAFLFASNVFAQVTPGFTTDEYKKALWMTTRFYGAQRSGQGPNWLLRYHEIKGNINPATEYRGGKSFLKDADGAYDLTGGWYDCGDHVKFGQTLFYAAYTLILGYSEFPEGYDDYYSFDYSGYNTVDDFSWAGKKVTMQNGIPDILDELKYATDYFQKVIRDNTTFYYEVGDGNADHQQWVTSSFMSTLPNANGGEANGSRVVKKLNGRATTMASLCGATLAAMARLYKPFDPEYAQSCLEKAIVCYEFVNGTTKGNTASPTFYEYLKGAYKQDQVVLYMELYRTTGETRYLIEAEALANTFSDNEWMQYSYFSYADTNDLCFYLLGMYGNTQKARAKTALQNTINRYTPSTAGSYLLDKADSDWGILRYMANQAFVHGLNAKLNDNTTTVNPYTIASIDHIFGKNSRNFSFIVGFGTNHAKYPHHRNYYGNNQNLSNGQGCPLPTGLEFGFLVGARDKDPAVYPDATLPYEASEGGIDYQAGLVGALGYINSILAPIDINKFGHPTPSLGDPQSLCGTGSVTLTATVDLSNLASGEQVTYRWFRGNTALTAENGRTSITINQAGTYHCDLVETSGAWTTRGSVEVTATLPDITLGDDVVLCTETSKLLDAGVSGEGITYTWKKDNVTIAGATAQTYTVFTAGTYSVTISASGCSSKSDEIEITSQLPLVQYDTICAPGTANLAVLSAGSYDWYDAATEGTKLASGATYSPAITANKIYYVQDASSVSGSVGAITSTGTAGNYNSSDISMAFTINSSFSIISMKMYVNELWNNPANGTVIVEILDGNGNAFTPAKTFTSDPKTITATGMTTFTFSNFNIDKAWGTNLRIRLSNVGFNGALRFYQSGATYPYNSTPAGVVTITGTYQGNNVQNSWYGYFFDWQISAGSSCARTPVLAVIDPTAEKCSTPIDTENPTTPGVIVISNLGETEFTATWTASTDNVGVVGYEVRIDGVLYETVTTTSIVVDELTADTEYEISVVAVDEAGNTSTVRTETVTTLFVDRIAPTIPGALIVSDVEETSFTATWTASTDNVGVVGYEVRIDGVLYETVPTTSIVIDELTADTEYEISVVAVDEAGNTSTARTETVTTLFVDRIAPTVPGILVFSDIEETEITVTWIASVDNIEVAGYEVWIGETLYETVTTGTNITIEGLTADTEYEISVIAYDEAENKSEPSTDMITTLATIVPTLTQTIELSAGWNLISIYVVPENATIESIFATIMIDVDIIKNADGFYKPGQPAALQSLTEMRAGYGYLVKMNTVATLQVQGAIAENVSVALKQGWNMIGHPYEQSKTTTATLAPIWNNTVQIKNFDGFLNQTSGTLNTMDAGKGYYIFMENAGIINF